MNLGELSSESVTERIRRVMDGYATKTATICTNGVFRARVNPEPTKQFTNSSELWYPPSSAVLFDGRFNRSGQTKFYVCNHPWAALLEVQPNVGDRITLLVIKSKRRAAEITCTHVGLSAGKERLDIKGTPHSANLADDPAFLNDLRTMGVEHKWHLIDEYLTQLAVALPVPNAAQDHYKATNAAADVLSAIRSQQALIYPSVATNLNSYNLAMNSWVADEFFLPFETWQLEVVSHRPTLPGALLARSGYFGVEVSARSERIEADGNIRWRVADTVELVDLQGAIRRAHAAHTGSEAA